MIFEMTAKDLEYHINLVEKAAVGFEKIDSNFQRGSAVGKMPSDSVACYGETICEESKILSVQQTSLLSDLRNRHSHPTLQQPPRRSVSGHQQGGWASTSREITTL